MEIVKDKRNAGVSNRRLSFPSEIGHYKRDNASRLASSKYRVLPEISDIGRNDKSSKSADSGKAGRQSGSQKTSTCTKQLRITKDKEIIEVENSKTQHNQADVQIFSLAIKLPDGRKIVSNFKGSDPIKCILRTVETKAGKSLKGCQLMCHKDQKVYDNMDVLLTDSGIEDKTTLYLQLPNE